MVKYFLFLKFSNTFTDKLLKNCVIWSPMVNYLISYLIVSQSILYTNVPLMYLKRERHWHSFIYVANCFEGVQQVVSSNTTARLVWRVDLADQLKTASMTEWSDAWYLYWKPVQLNEFMTVIKSRLFGQTAAKAVILQAMDVKIPFGIVTLLRR